jgi:hypothetical protein
VFARIVPSRLMFSRDVILFKESCVKRGTPVI